MEFSGASRPLLIYRRGQVQLFKNSQDSIGGYLSDTKNFETKYTSLESGDIIYLFSDGYHDQFGGSNNKKMQIKGLVNFISKIVHLPMDQQLEYVKSYFYEWKDDWEQIDDVLFMGLYF